MVMDSNGKSGRQEVIAAYFDFDIEDFKDAAGTVVNTAVPIEGSLPSGAVVLPYGSFVMVTTAFNGTTQTLDIGDTSESTPDVDKYLDGGSLATTNTMVAISNSTGYEVPKACNLTLKLSATDSTEGVGRICILYVVNGRSAFSQG